MNATEINQRSAVLWTYLGMTLSNCDKSQEALKCFAKAESLDSGRPLTKYQKVTVLQTLGRYQECLEVLEELTKIVPKEAPIHITMGKIYKLMGRKADALRAYNKALDLDPKDTNMVKTLIDKLHQNDDMTEDNDLPML